MSILFLWAVKQVICASDTHAVLRTFAMRRVSVTTQCLPLLGRSFANVLKIIELQRYNGMPLCVVGLKRERPNFAPTEET